MHPNALLLRPGFHLIQLVLHLSATSVLLLSSSQSSHRLQYCQRSREKKSLPFRGWSRGRSKGDFFHTADHKGSVKAMKCQYKLFILPKRPASNWENAGTSCRRKSQSLVLNDNVTVHSAVHFRTAECETGRQEE